MSMQQALGAVGFVVGAYFGYPQLGFVVGSLVGAALTPAQKVEGPRIDDQKVTVSTEGAGIPRVWGTVRLGGNVIESTDKIEVASTESQGKGGGVESTTYKYYVDMRTMLCEAREGVSVAIRKIWKDGKLIYDAGDGISIGAAIASSENPAASLILYQGDESQLPDPTEEARYGVGNVSAYRGVVSIVMNAVECPGGRVPQFSFELCAGADVTPVTSVFTTFEDSPVGYTSIIGSESIMHVAAIRQGGDNYATSYLLTPGADIPASSSRTSFASPLNFQPMTAVVGSQATPQTAFSEYVGADEILYAALDHNTGISSTIYQGSYADGRAAIQYACQDAQEGGYVLKVDNTSLMLAFPQGSYSNSVAGTIQGRCYFGRVLSTAYSLTPGVVRIDRQRLESDGSWSTVSDIALGTFALDVNVLLLETAGGLFARVIESGDKVLSFYRADTVATLLSENFSERWPAAFETTFFCSEQYAIVGPFYAVDGSASFDMIRHSVITPALVPVAQVISDECEQAGLSADHFDVSTLSEEVHGYTITNPASARAAVQPLMTAFAIDATDEDEKIKFFNRSDKTSLATIGYDELGCVEDGSEPGDPMPLTRANVTELARSVTVSYINRDFDYQTSTEEARRQVTGATADQNVEIAISMDSSQAATAAHRILYDAHNDRNRRSMKLSRKYACYSAGDVLTVEYPRGTLSDWRWLQATDTGALIEVECVPADAELYAQTAVGATGYEGQEVSSLAPATRMEILDIPILNDAGNNAGLYVAMAGVAPGWSGAEIFAGDDDASLQSRGTVGQEAVIGLAETKLGDWSLGVIDETNLLTVDVGHHALSSITQDVLLTGTSNAAAIGAAGRWEIVKFQRADALGSGRYILSGLLRGQRGTEWARASHTAGDRFVLLSLAGMLRPNFDAGSIGQTKAYRAISKGRSLNSATSMTYANTAEGLEPFAPSNLAKALSSGNIVFSWVRRTRLSESWLAGIVPLGEAAEMYEVVLYTSSAFTTVRRVISSSTASATYTTAMQTEDGYVSGALYVRVYQISDITGRGHALEATI